MIPYDPDEEDSKLTAAATGCLIGCFILGAVICTLGFLTLLRWLTAHL